MKKFGDTVTNQESGKHFFVSTVPVNPLGEWFWQSAVFKQRFGPFAGVFRPVIFLGATAEVFAERQHQKIVELVREVPPGKWNEARDHLLRTLLDEEFARQESDSEDFFQEMLKATGDSSD